ncbi:hypothetical protein [Streptomyces sioyaensis]|uniref:hypothetical protein n=1 Tax=Streptomyces sioyaensis TaxID=67364 RepID=UPI0037B475B7
MLKWLQEHFDKPAKVAPILIPLLGFIALIIFSASTSGVSVGSVFATGTLVAVAAATVGGLLGFIFAIPRSGFGAVREESAEAAGNGGTTKRWWVPNSNLEQISDWLTKILVGVGLVQIGNSGVPARHLIEAVASGFGRGDSMGGARVFAASLIVAFTVWGFIVGYIYTYTKMPPRFRGAYVVVSRE